MSKVVKIDSLVAHIVEIPNLECPVIIDLEDVARASSVSWFVAYKSGTPYIQTGTKKGGYKRTIQLARFIMNPLDWELVDHCDRNTLDNRKSNLRLCNKKENAFNSKKRSGVTSKFKGVSWDKARRRWKAVTAVKGRQIFLGRFNTEREAAQAYNGAVMRLCGAFAVLNNVEEPL